MTVVRTPHRVPAHRSGRTSRPFGGARAAEFLPDATTSTTSTTASSPTSATTSVAGSVPERVDDLVRAAAAGGSGCRHVHVLLDLGARRARRRGGRRAGAAHRRGDGGCRGRARTPHRACSRRCRRRAARRCGSSRSAPSSRACSREFTSEVIEGAFAAVVVAATGRRTTGSSPPRSSAVAADVDVVVLAQASMASAARRLSGRRAGARPASSRGVRRSARRWWSRCLSAGRTSCVGSASPTRASAVRRSVTSVVTQPPARAPWIASSLRGPPAMPTRRGMRAQVRRRGSR